MKKKIIVIVILIVLILVALVLFLLKDKIFTNNKSNDQSSTTQSSESKSIPEPTSEEDKVLFNATFDAYKGNNMTGIQAKTLISTIKNQNAKNSNNKISIFLNEEEISDSSKIEQNKKYSISFEYSENGLINKAIIKGN